MNNDLVIGIDSSTTGTKAIAWNRFGVAIAEGRCPISMSNPRPGHFEQTSSDWTSAVEAIQGVLGKVSPERIVALSNRPRPRRRPRSRLLWTQETRRLPTTFKDRERERGRRRGRLGEYPIPR